MPPRLLPLAALPLLIACSKGDSTGPGGGTTGSLAITITAPAGVTGDVSVLGPGGYRNTLSASQTLGGLAVGIYSVSAGAGTTADPIVGTGYAGTVTGSPAVVTAGGTADASVTYTTAWANAGVLWVANEIGGTIVGFTSPQLSSTGTPVPAVVLGNGSGTSSARNPVGMAIDDAGGLWFSDLSDTLRYFRASQITGSTNAAAAIKIAVPSITSATAIAIDAQGDLWVADQYNNTVSEFTANQIAFSGTLTPSLTIGAVFGTIARPWGLAFDAKGDLWVANLDGNSVVGYSPAQLTASGAPVPFAGLSGSKGLAGCLGIAFDAQGNLWVGTIVDSISKFNASDLTSIGTPTPSVVLSGAIIRGAIGMAFDNSGALWVASYQASTLLRYDATQLATTGSPTPAVTISKTGSSLGLPAGIVFSPGSNKLPIH